jgi:hypothetical protein
VDVFTAFFVHDILSVWRHFCANRGSLQHSKLVLDDFLFLADLCASSMQPPSEMPLHRSAAVGPASHSKNPLPADALCASVVEPFCESCRSGDEAGPVQNAAGNGSGEETKSKDSDDESAESRWRFGQVREVNRALMHIKRTPLALEVNEMVECEVGGCLYPARVASLDKVNGKVRTVAHFAPCHDRNYSSISGSS